MHGLAGSAAVALLVLATARSVHTAIGYLLVFGVGTVLGMMLVTALIARPLARTGTWPEARQRAFVRVTGIVSVAVGLFLVYRVGVVDGLFTAAPSWTPR
jgi:high-affinity nickel-transport protein